MDSENVNVTFSRRMYIFRNNVRWRLGGYNGPEPFFYLLRNILQRAFFSLHGVYDIWRYGCSVVVNVSLLAFGDWCFVVSLKTGATDSEI